MGSPPIPLRAPSVSQVVNGGADLERGTQFDVHSGHEVLLPEQEQGLPVDLLGEELTRQVFTTWEEVTERNCQLTQYMNNNILLLQKDVINGLRQTGVNATFSGKMCPHHPPICHKN